jgi:hypothetical protein
VAAMPLGFPEVLKSDYSTLPITFFQMQYDHAGNSESDRGVRAN